MTFLYLLPDFSEVTVYLSRLFELKHSLEMRRVSADIYLGLVQLKSSPTLLYLILKIDHVIAYWIFISFSQAI